MKKVILLIGAILNLLLAIFHCFFWELFGWSEQLPLLSIDNSGIMQIANIIMIFILFYFALISYLAAKKQPDDYFALATYYQIVGFYSIRIITGFIFFKIDISEIIVALICLIISGGYLYVARAKN